MASRFEEAKARLFSNVFVCRRCKKKIRATSAKIRAGKVACRGCTGKVFRPIKSKK